MRVAGLIILFSILAYGQQPSPELLLIQAKQILEQPGRRNDAISLLRQANNQWRISGSKSSEYAESLDILAMLLNSNSVGDRAEVQSFAKPALEIRQSEADSASEGLAIALEVEADVLGRSEAEAQADWTRASAIRAKRVAATQRSSSTQDDVFRQIFKIGNGVSPPMLIKKSEPEYTKSAIYRKLVGTVVLFIVIDASGKPGNFQLLRGLGYGLDEEAAAAVSRWQFRPAQKDGRPVAVQATIEVNFRLLAGAPGS